MSISVKATVSGDLSMEIKINKHKSDKQQADECQRRREQKRNAAKGKQQFEKKIRCERKGEKKEEEKRGGRANRISHKMRFAVGRLTGRIRRLTKLSRA